MCATIAGWEMTFPDVVWRLTEAGVERYHADYTRGETTYYTVNGESHAVRLEHADGAIAMAFQLRGWRPR